MSWAEVSTVNGDFLNAPLDIKMHLADYKMYGEDSYVFQQKELLHGLYECTYISMNDRELILEAFVYLIENNKHIGEAFSNIYEIGNKLTLKGLRTMQAVAASSTAMQAVLASSTAMQAVLASSTAMQAVAASSTAMQAVLASSTAMQAVLASSTAMQAVASSSTAIAGICKSNYSTTKAVIKVINNNDDYVKKVFDTVTSDKSKFQNIVNQYNDGVASLNQYCNTPNTIILCALGYYGGDSGSTSVFINNEAIKTSMRTGGSNPQSVNRNNCNAIAVPTATFTENGDGYAAIAVYKAI